MGKILRTTNIPLVLCRVIVGLIFLSEGIQKFLYPGTVGEGRFAKIGFTNAAFWASFVACFEIGCGALILFGFLTRLAAIPLFIIMITAFVSTKWPILVKQGFWPMAHEYRTDFALTLLLILLFTYGAGNYSLDKLIYNREKNEVGRG